MKHETCSTEIYILFTLVDGGLSYDDLWPSFFFPDASLLLMMLLFQWLHVYLPVQTCVLKACMYTAAAGETHTWTRSVVIVTAFTFPPCQKWCFTELCSERSRADLVCKNSCCMNPRWNSKEILLNVNVAYRSGACICSDFVERQKVIPQEA